MADEQDLPVVRRGETGNRRVKRARKRVTPPANTVVRTADVYYRSDARSAVEHGSPDHTTKPGEAADVARKTLPGAQTYNTDRYYREAPRRATAPPVDAGDPLRGAVAADSELQPVLPPRLGNKFKTIELSGDKEAIRAGLARVVELAQASHQVRVVVPQQHVRFARTFLDLQKANQSLTPVQHANVFVAVAAPEPPAEAAPAPVTATAVTSGKSAKSKASKGKSTGKSSAKTVDPLRAAGNAEPLTLDDLVRLNEEDDALDAASAHDAPRNVEVIEGDDAFLLGDA